MKPSEAAKAKAAVALMGHEVSEVTRRKISEKRKGFVMSEAQKELLSNIRTGTHLPPETRTKLSEAGRRRRQSAASRAKLSALKKGIPLTEAHKAALRGKRGKLENVRLSKLGKKNPNFGKPRSEETKRKIREANQRTWRLNHALTRITKSSEYEG